MTSYIPCAVKALTKKEVKWTRVEHGNWQYKYIMLAYKNKKESFKNE